MRRTCFGRPRYYRNGISAPSIDESRLRIHALPVALLIRLHGHVSKGKHLHKISSFISIFQIGNWVFVLWMAGARH